MQVLVANAILLYTILYLTALTLLNVILMNEYQHEYIYTNHKEANKMSKKAFSFSRVDPVHKKSTFFWLRDIGANFQ